MPIFPPHPGAEPLGNRHAWRFKPLLEAVDLREERDSAGKIKGSDHSENAKNDKA